MSSAFENRAERTSAFLDADPELDAAWDESFEFTSDDASTPVSLTRLFEELLLAHGPEVLLCEWHKHHGKGGRALFRALLLCTTLPRRLVERAWVSLARFEPAHELGEQLSTRDRTAERSPPDLILLANMISRTGPPTARFADSAGTASRPAIHSTAAAA